MSCKVSNNLRHLNQDDITYLLNGGTGLHSFSSSVPAMTSRYLSSTSGLVKSRWNERVCFIHFSLSSSALAVTHHDCYSLVTLWEVFSGVGTSRLLSGSSGNDCLDSVLHDVPKFKSLDQVAERQSSHIDLNHDKTYVFQIILLSLIPTWSYDL